MDILQIAQLEETRLAIGVAEISDHTLPIQSGGVAYRGMPGSWNNIDVDVELARETRSHR